MDNNGEKSKMHVTLGFLDRKAHDFSLSMVPRRRNRSYSTKEKLSKGMVPKPKPKETDMCPSPISLTEDDKKSAGSCKKSMFSSISLNQSFYVNERIYGVSDIPEETHETEAISDGEEFSSKLNSPENSEEDEEESASSENDKIENCSANNKNVNKDSNINYQKHKNSIKKTRERMNKIKAFHIKSDRKSSDDLSNKRRIKYYEKNKIFCVQKFIDKIKKMKKNRSSSEYQECDFNAIKHNTISYNRRKINVTSILGYLEKE